MPQDVLTETPPVLRRTLGPFDGAALVVANVIGVGIFTVPGVVAGMVAEPFAFFAVWIVGGVFALIGALAYAELAAMLPRAGGEYLYLREAFGPLAGFLTGWTSFVAGFSGAIAAAAIGFAAYLGRFFPVALDADPFFSIPLGIARLSFSPQTLVALAVIFIISAIHIRGVNPGRRFQNGLAGACLLAVGFFVVMGFLAEGRAEQAPLPGPADTGTGASAWLLALIPVMFTYSGWNAAVYVAEEVRDPTRNVFKALMLGTAAVIIAYLLLNGLYLHALPLARLADVIEVGDAAAEVLFGSIGASLLSVVVLLALASNVSAMVMAGPRIYYAMARDGLFPGAMQRVYLRRQTPAVAIAAQAVWSAVLVLTGTFEDLLVYTGFAIVLFSAVAVSALYVLRRTHAADGMPLRGPGQRVLPLLFIAFSLVVVVNALYGSPLPSAAGLLVISAGIPVYWWLRRRHGTRR
ncbi:MAG: APC family permease [Rhodothermales bacterium]